VVATNDPPHRPPLAPPQSAPARTVTPPPPPPPPPRREPSLSPEQVQVLVTRIQEAPHPWEEAGRVLDRLLAKGLPQTGRQLLDLLPPLLGPPPSPALRGDLVLRRLQLTVEEPAPAVREAAYREALAQAPGHPGALAALIDLLVAGGRHAEAVPLCRTLLAQHREELPPPVRSRIYAYLAERRLADEGDTPSAQRLARADLEKALQATPEQQPLRLWLAELSYRTGSAPEGLTLLQQGTRFASDQVGYLVEAAAVLRRLQKLEDAEQLLVEARRQREDDQRPLRQLIELHRQRGQLREVVRDLAGMILLAPPQSAPRERAAAYYTMGQLYQDQLADPDTALACYLQALELDGTLLDALARATELLAAAEDWSGLQGCLRRQLARLPESTPTGQRAALLENLGAAHRRRGGEVAEAIAAYEAAWQLDPTNEEPLLALAELYEQLPGAPATLRRQAQRQLLIRQPERIASLRELRRVALELGETDEAWCVTARLVADGQATPAEEAFFHNLQRPELPLATPLPEAAWASGLRLPEFPAELEYLLAATAPALLPLFAASPRSLELRPREQVLPEAPLPVNRALSRLVDLLGLPRPLAYRQATRPGITLFPSLPPLLLLGEEQLAGRTLTQLLAPLGRELILLRGGNLLTRCLEPPALRWLLGWILAHLGLAAPPDGSPTGQQVLAALRQELPDPAPLLPHAQRLLETPALLEPSTFLPGLQGSAARLALLLTEDLPCALEAFPPEIAPGLRSFAVSPAYLELRRTLGIAFAGDPPDGPG